MSSTSFPFDLSSLPQITTRKALLLVDFQNDFLDPDHGALPVIEPDGYVERAIQLSHDFRAIGDIVWVKSQFQECRPVDDTQIIVADESHTADKTSSSKRDQRPSARRLRSLKLPTPPPVAVDRGKDHVQADEEAFLSHQPPKCVRQCATGSEMPAEVKQAVRKNDLVLTKSHYSAFEQTELIRMLRGKMVTEVFVCGSLANVGVYATAMGAAGHGMTITVVEDCCGYRNEASQRQAVNQLLELTGCEFASHKEVLEMLPQAAAAPSQKSPSAAPPLDTEPEERPAQLSTTTTATAFAAQGRSRSSPDIVNPMNDLRLASNSPDVSSDAVKGNFPRGEAGLHTGGPINSLQTTRRDKGKDGVGIRNEEGEDSRSQTESISATPQSAEANQLDKAVRPPSQEALITSHNSITKARTFLPPENPIQIATTETMVDLSNDRESPAAQQRQLCSGDTDIIENVLPPTLAGDVFAQLRDEIQWQRMSHQGGDVPRLVAVQGLVDEDGSVPIYRHPTDESVPLLPFSETVLAIKNETEKHLGHTLNHVLIQFYRDGDDYISEHSDKTLDIVKGSYIANVSLGAERVMVLRTKRRDKEPSSAGEVSSSTPNTDMRRQVQRARLPHNSLCRMGLKTNAEWLHAIRQDKRAPRDKTPAELAYKGGRISLTFRQIGTFLDKDERTIWGQGATGKTKKDAHRILNGQTPAAIKMLRAFGTENHSSAFDWDAHYGDGFDVLHISRAPRLFTSCDPVANLRVSLMLAELGIKYAKGSIAPVWVNKEDSASHVVVEDSHPIKFVDNDEAKTIVQGDMAIMLYLEARYGARVDQQQLGKLYTLFQRSLQLHHRCNNILATEAKDQAYTLVKEQLQAWEKIVPPHAQERFLTDEKLALPDLALWPAIHAAVQHGGPDILEGLANVAAYYWRIAERESVQMLIQRVTEKDVEA